MTTLDVTAGASASSNKCEQWVATNVVVVSSTLITATTPASGPGSVTVTVTVNGQSGSLTNGFAYIGTPTATSVTPNSGSELSWTAVTVAATNFATGATVTFGGTAATNVVVVNSTTITATTPVGFGGVTVTNLGGKAGVWPTDTPSWTQAVSRFPVTSLARL